MASTALTDIGRGQAEPHTLFADSQSQKPVTSWDSQAPSEEGKKNWNPKHIRVWTLLPLQLESPSSAVPTELWGPKSHGAPRSRSDYPQNLGKQISSILELLCHKVELQIARTTRMSFRTLDFPGHHFTTYDAKQVRVHIVRSSWSWVSHGRLWGRIKLSFLKIKSREKNLLKTYTAHT